MYSSWSGTYAYEYTAITATVLKLDISLKLMQRDEAEFDGLNTNRKLKYEPDELKKKENTSDGLWYYLLCNKIW